MTWGLEGIRKCIRNPIPEKNGIDVMSLPLQDFVLLVEILKGENWNFFLRLIPELSNLFDSDKIEFI
jgi:hypothetical protein